MNLFLSKRRHYPLEHNRHWRLIFPLLCVYLAACAHQHSAHPVIVQSSASAAPISLTFSQMSDHAITAQLARPARPGLTTVHLRNLQTQTITTASLGTNTNSSTGPSFVLPSPWNGELKITSPGKTEALTESAFVAIVVEPVFPRAKGEAPRIIYGPYGRLSVRFTKKNSPPTGTQMFMTSPAISPPASSPAGLLGDTVEIGFLPPLSKATEAVIGLSPLSLPDNARPTVVVFDPKTQAWSALASHVGRDGAVYASGPVPGVYALTVSR